MKAIYRFYPFYVALAMTLLFFYTTLSGGSLSRQLLDSGLVSQAVAVKAEASRLEQAQLTAYLATLYDKPVEAVREYVRIAWKVAADQSLPPLLLLAIIQQESGMDRTARNAYGAIGLMQVVPRFHPGLVRSPEELLSPRRNIAIGAHILARYLRAAGGDLRVALRRYSGGSASYAAQVLQREAALCEVPTQI